MAARSSRSERCGVSPRDGRRGTARPLVQTAMHAGKLQSECLSAGYNGAGEGGREEMLKNAVSLEPLRIPSLSLSRSVCQCLSPVVTEAR